ncbi:MAG: hypothetical protein AAGA90_01395 [Actinomycetota bacterium]
MLIFDRRGRELRNAIEHATVSIRSLPEVGFDRAAEVTDEAAARLMVAARRLADRGRADDARRMLADARPDGCGQVDQLISSVLDQTVMSIRKG